MEAHLHDHAHDHHDHDDDDDHAHHGHDHDEHVESSSFFNQELLRLYGNNDAIDVAGFTKLMHALKLEPSDHEDSVPASFRLVSFWSLTRSSISSSIRSFCLNYSNLMRALQTILNLNGFALPLST